MQFQTQTTMCHFDDICALRREGALRIQCGKSHPTTRIALATAVLYEDRLKAGVVRIESCKG